MREELQESGDLEACDYCSSTDFVIAKAAQPGGSIVKCASCARRAYTLMDGIVLAESKE